MQLSSEPLLQRRPQRVSLGRNGTPFEPVSGVPFASQVLRDQAQLILPAQRALRLAHDQDSCVLSQFSVDVDVAEAQLDITDDEVGTRSLPAAACRGSVPRDRTTARIGFASRPG